MEATPSREEPVVPVDPMGGVTAPPASAPAAPSRTSVSQLSGDACLGGHASELSEFQSLGRKLQDATNAGKQLCHVLTSRLHRSDTRAASSALEQLRLLPSPKDVIGEVLWADLRARLRLCESGGVGHFVENYVSSLGLLSFFERGVLTPEMPEAWQTGIPDYDDERYLLGVINALRELERFGVNRGQELDLRSVRLCLGAAQALEEALMQFDLRNSELRRRFDGVKYCVKRFETLAYEVDLALQRAAAGAAASGAAAAGADEDAAGAVAPAEGPVADAAPGVVTVIDLSLLGSIKIRYDAFDATREQVLKRARDVLKCAKNAIYALQRGDFRKADGELTQCAKDANSIHEQLVGEKPALRHSLFGASLEEMAEALAYRAFRKDKKVLSLAEMQAASGLTFPLSLGEYLGGIMDLTGEVGRLAVRSASKGRQAVPDVELCLACVDAVYTGLQDLPSLPSGLGKKMGMVKGTLTKIEGVLYELSLLSQGMRVAAPVAGADEVGGDD